MAILACVTHVWQQHQIHLGCRVFVLDIGCTVEEKTNKLLLLLLHCASDED